MLRAIQFSSNVQGLFKCAGPVHKVSNVTFTKQPGANFRATWSLEKGCVSSTSVQTYILKWRVTYTISGETYRAEGFTEVGSSTLYATFSVLSSLPQGVSFADVQSVELKSIEIVPKSIEFGADSYPYWVNLSWSN